MKLPKRFLLAVYTLITGITVASISLSVAWFIENRKVETDGLSGSVLQSYFDTIFPEKGETLPDGSAPSGDYGKEQNPFVITRPKHWENLVKLQYQMNGFASSDYYFQVGKNFGDGNGVQVYKYDDDGKYTEEKGVILNLSGLDALPPLGSNDLPFQNHIEGNGISIQNFKVAGTDFSGNKFGDIGIFGYVDEKGTCSNVFFDGFEIDTHAASYIVGSSSTVDEKVVGHVAHSQKTLTPYVGYIAGHMYNASNFTNVYVNNCELNTGTGSVDYDSGLTDNFGYYGHVDVDALNGETGKGHNYKFTLDANAFYSYFNASHSQIKDETLLVRGTKETGGNPLMITDEDKGIAATEKAYIDNTGKTTKTISNAVSSTTGTANVQTYTLNGNYSGSSSAAESYSVSTMGFRSIPYTYTERFFDLKYDSNNDSIGDTNIPSTVYDESGNTLTKGAAIMSEHNAEEIVRKEKYGTRLIMTGTDTINGSTVASSLSFKGDETYVLTTTISGTSYTADTGTWIKAGQIVTLTSDNGATKRYAEVDGDNLKLAWTGVYDGTRSGTLNLATDKDGLQDLVPYSQTSGSYVYYNTSDGCWKYLRAHCHEATSGDTGTFVVSFPQIETDGTYCGGINPWTEFVSGSYKVYLDGSLYQSKSLSSSAFQDTSPTGINCVAGLTLPSVSFSSQRFGRHQIMIHGTMSYKYGNKAIWSTTRGTLTRAFSFGASLSNGTLKPWSFDFTPTGEDSTLFSGALKEFSTDTTEPTYDSTGFSELNPKPVYYETDHAEYTIYGRKFNKGDDGTYAFDNVSTAYDTKLTEENSGIAYSDEFKTLKPSTPFFWSSHYTAYIKDSSSADKKDTFIADTQQLVDSGYSSSNIDIVGGDVAFASQNVSIINTTVNVISLPSESSSSDTMVKSIALSDHGKTFYATERMPTSIALYIKNTANARDERDDTLGSITFSYATIDAIKVFGLNVGSWFRRTFGINVADPVFRKGGKTNVGFDTLGDETTSGLVRTYSVNNLTESLAKKISYCCLDKEGKILGSYNSSGGLGTISEEDQAQIDYYVICIGCYASNSDPTDSWVTKVDFSYKAQDGYGGTFGSVGYRSQGQDLLETTILNLYFAVAKTKTFSVKVSYELSGSGTSYTGTYTIVANCSDASSYLTVYLYSSGRTLDSYGGSSNVGFSYSYTLTGSMSPPSS